MFSRLIYVSEAVPPIAMNLRAILNTSRGNNFLTSIKGALCLHGDVFLQCLEGPPDAVDTLYSKIETDARHSNVRLLYRQAVTKRLFINYRMALLTWNQESQQVFDTHLDGGMMDPYEIRPAHAAALVETLAGRACWSEV